MAEKISASLHSLAQTGFTVRGIVTDNHNSNVNAFKSLKQKFGKGDQLFIQHPSNPHKNIYLFFDTPHLIKNVRNNLLNSRRFVFPQFDYEKDGIEIHCPAGYLAWSDLHQILSHQQNWLSIILAIVLRSWITHTTSFKHTVSGMCGQHILKFLIGFLPRLTFVVQNITIGD